MGFFDKLKKITTNLFSVFSLFYRIPPGITSEIFLRLFHFREKRV